MHMARLWDASRLAGYSLEVLTDELVGRRKAPMKELFGIPALKKDGQPGRKLDMPSIEELQNNPLTRPDWIQYACYDSQGTWLLHEELRRRLTSMDWADGEVFGEPNLYHYYTRYWRPFGELLTSMEREGIKVDSTNQLPAAERRAIAQRAKLEEFAAVCDENVNPQSKGFFEKARAVFKMVQAGATDSRPSHRASPFFHAPILRLPGPVFSVGLHTVRIRGSSCVSSAAPRTRRPGRDPRWPRVSHRG
jgi:hypothetical protein